ncbi:MAG: hypothetical protein JO219_12640 [Candidatus Eremiobacteraeota bacterium]|nr:hypothetical protein [Candidatus Eremiobacteraeota bacterium]
MRKQILTQGNVRKAESTRLNRAEMHAYYIAFVTMSRLVFNRSTLGVPS